MFAEVEVAGIVLSGMTMGGGDLLLRETRELMYCFVMVK